MYTETVCSNLNSEYLKSMIHDLNCNIYSLRRATVI